jgi:uncharacterized protein (DUF1778 family)
LDIDALTPLRARGSRSPRGVFSLRIAGEELELIAEAAEAQNMTVSEFIRRAALAHTKASAEGNPDLRQLSEKLDALDQKLDAVMAAL